MKLLIDYAELERIKELCAAFPIDGVTTNPSILAKNGKSPFSTLREIRTFIGDAAELHVQVIAQQALEMVEEARRIQRELGETTYIKIPVTKEGLKAIKRLHAEGANVTATAIYTPLQAYLAGKAGADYAAPYVNRIDNLGANGVKAAKTMQDIFVNNGLKTEILAASFKNSQQVLELCEYGIGAVTIAPDVMEGLLVNDSVQMAVHAFISDFETLCGAGKTMKDC